MKDVVVVNKLSLEKVVLNAENIDLSASSIIHLKIKKDEVLEFIQQGNTLILKLKNGELLVIQDFFVKDKNDVSSDLVFEDDACAFLWFNFDNGVASFKSISGLEALLPAASSSFFSGTTGWLLGGAALLGGIAAGAGGGSGGGNGTQAAPRPTVKVSVQQNIDNNKKATVEFEFDKTIAEGSFTKDSITVLGGKLVDGSLKQDVNDPNKWIAEVDLELGGELKVDVLPETYKDLNGSFGLGDTASYITNIITKLHSDLNEQNDNATHIIEGKTAPNKKLLITLIDGETAFAYSNEKGNWSYEFSNIKHLAPFESLEIQVIENETDVVLLSEKILSDNYIDISPKGEIEIHLRESEHINFSDIKVFDSNNVAIPVKFEIDPERNVIKGNIPEGILSNVTVSIKNNYDISATNYVDTDIPLVKIQIERNGEIILKYPNDVDEDSIDISRVQVSASDGTKTIVSNFERQSDNSYRAKILEPQEFNGLIKVSVPAESYKDNVGNNGRSNDTERLIDTIAPEVFINIFEATNGVVNTVFKFSKAIDPKTFDLNDLKLNYGSFDRSSFKQLSEDEWTVNIEGIEEGRLLKVGFKEVPVDISIRPVEDDIAVVLFKADLDSDASPFNINDVIIENGILKTDNFVKKIVDGNTYWALEISPYEDKELNVQYKLNYYDNAGNVGYVSDAEYKLINIDILEVKPNDDYSNTIVSGTSAPNQVIDVELTFNEDGEDINVLKTIQVDDNGKWMLELNQSPLNLKNVIATTKNWHKETISDQVIPSIVTIDVIEGDDFIDHSELENIMLPGNGLLITGKIINPQDEGDLVVEIYQDPNSSRVYRQTEETLIVNSDGTWTLKAPYDDLSKESTSIIVTAYIEKDDKTISNTATRTPDINDSALVPEIVIEANGEIKIEFPEGFNKSSLPVDAITVKDAQDQMILLDFVQSDTNPNLYIAKMPLGKKEDVNVTVKGGWSARDGNGITFAKHGEIETIQPTVLVEFNDKASSKNSKVFDISFSEEIKSFNVDAKGPADSLKEILKAYAIENPSSNITLESLMVEDVGNNKFRVTVEPVDELKRVTVLVEESSYQDLNGNWGANTSGNISDGAKDILNLVEAGVDSRNQVIDGIPCVDVILENGSLFKQVSTTEFGSLIFFQDTGTNENKAKYQLYNDKIEALKQGEEIFEAVSYSYQDDSGKIVYDTLLIEITGTNDAPEIMQVTTFRSLVTEENSSFSSGTLSNPTSVNSKLENRHPITFKLEEGDASTTQIYVNLKVLDNSFKVVVNGKTIHLNEVFQIEAGDQTTPTQVPLKFADGTWLASGAPWNANENGLSRFQIIISEDGVRFFGTKTTKSQYLEEIFYDTSYATGIQLPEFKVGDNLLEIVSVDGVGIDSIQGYATITAGGKFALSDIDSDYLSKVELTLYGGNIQKDTFIPVLPKGITYSIVEESSNLKLILSGKALVTDYEDSLNSLMFKSSEQKTKEMTLKIFDDHGAFDVLDGVLDYQIENGTIKITSVDFQITNKLMFDENSLADLLNNEDQSVNAYEDNGFKLGSSQKIDVSALLDDSANSTNLSDYILIDYKEADKTTIISIDRDGILKDAYREQELLILTNQKQSFDLEDLMNNNQIIY